MISPILPTSVDLEERFNLMLSLLAFEPEGRRRGSSLLCRVLDGRDLEEICPIDEAILTPDERVRYRQLRPPHQRALAFHTRAELRRMLGREIGLAPQSVPLEYDINGKPHCPHPRAKGLEFSVSCAHRCSLIAIGEASGLGVDVERTVETEPDGDLLEIVFSERELDAWLSVPPGMRRIAFTDAWTIKEATLKAMGVGLNGSPHDITVRFNDEGRALPVFKDPNCIFERVNFCPCYSASCVMIL